MAEMTNLPVQVSCGSGVRGRLSHEGRNSGLLGGRSETEAIIVYIHLQPPKTVFCGTR